MAVEQEMQGANILGILCLFDLLKKLLPCWVIEMTVEMGVLFTEWRPEAEEGWITH